METDGDKRESGERHGGTAGRRLVLRPIASPFPIGVLALAVAALMVSGLQLGWVPARQAAGVGLALVAFVAPLQLAAAFMALLARDDAVTGVLSVQGATHLVIGIDLLAGGAAYGDALGLFLVLAAAVLAVPAAISYWGKLVPAVLATAVAVRFALDGMARFAGGGWEEAAGATGVAVCALALYTALALMLEDVAGRTVLPLGRLGRDRDAGPPPTPELASRAGVRDEL